MTPRVDELKRYVRFDANDAKSLVALRAKAAPHFTRIAREFYDRIREHEDAHAVFTGEAQIERLQRSLVRWLERLLSGTYDDAYFEETRKIGRVHVQVGLPQPFVFTAMALIRVTLDDIAARELGDQAPAARSALMRLLDVELAIMAESYADDLTAQLRRRDEIEAQSLRGDLARSVRLYQAAVDASPSLVVGLDREGRIRLFNRAAQVATGWALEDVYGARFVDVLVPDEVRASDAEVVDTVLAAQQTEQTMETLYRTRSGRVRDVTWQLRHIDDADVALFATGNDVTDVRAAARRVRQHEKLAAVGTLAAGLAHEIRNPLNGAQLHLAYLQRGLEKNGGSEDLREAAGVVADEIKRLSALVTEFLDFARPSVPNRRAVVAQAILARAVELTRPCAEASGVTIEVDVPPADIVLHADAAKLEQVLLNLVQNAIEALAPSGAGKIVVRARRRPRDVLFEVVDDGPGLDDPEAAVFDAFYSTKPGGTGLGLAITHRIVTDHGGSIDFESGSGKTTFRFLIPITRELNPDR